jgi:hypothetical protein
MVFPILVMDKVASKDVNSILIGILFFLMER